MWGERLAAGQIWRNGQQLWGDGPLAAGDRLVWHRPPWQEAAVPVLPSPLFDDGDLVVFNKPSGLQVLPAGGFLRHTVLGQLEAQGSAARPVHRLGRFTSGLLVCARSRAARAHLSAQLRDSTVDVSRPKDTGFARNSSESGDPIGDCDALKKHAKTLACFLTGPEKIYRALLRPPQEGSPLLGLGLGQSLTIDTPIGRRPHPRLGSIWCAAALSPDALAARSRFTLLEVRAEGWLFAVAIATGRPHQIRIHAAAAGAPLLGDPLYVPGGLAGPDALPGDGGYRLHAHRFSLSTPDGRALQLQAPLPPELECAGDRSDD